MGVCLSYKRGSQPLYNLPASTFGLQEFSHSRITIMQQYHLRPTVGLQENFPPPNYKHSYELRPTCGKISVIVIYLEINYILQTSFYFSKNVYFHTYCVYLHEYYMHECF